jgi:hypothetical protein
MGMILAIMFQTTTRISRAEFVLAALSFAAMIL